MAQWRQLAACNNGVAASHVKINRNDENQYQSSAYQPGAAWRPAAAASAMAVMWLLWLAKMTVANKLSMTMILCMANNWNGSSRLTGNEILINIINGVMAIMAAKPGIISKWQYRNKKKKLNQPVCVYQLANISGNKRKQLMAAIS